MLPIRRISASSALVAAACLGSFACSGPAPDDESAERAYRLDPQVVFWQSLQSLCGKAFEGRLVESVPPDDSFDGRRLVMHVRECDVGEVRIPFFVGDDRSRTWVVTTTAAGLRLEHVHRHEDGTEDEISRYGGETRGPGSAQAQDFHADGRTAELVPAAASNIWTIEVHRDSALVYALRRTGSDRLFRVVFDLGEPVPEPPPPWGPAREPWTSVRRRRGWNRRSGRSYISSEAVDRRRRGPIFFGLSR